MTEQEWLTSIDPQRMLAFVTADRRNEDGIWPLGYKPATDRQLRLFAVACCRLRGTADSVVDGYERDGAPLDGYDMPGEQHTDLEWALEWCRISPKVSQEDKSALLRCIFGNPWRLMEVYDETIIGQAGFSTQEPRKRIVKRIIKPWITPQVVAFAQNLYDSRQWDAMPALADMLEENNCTDRQILDHLRSADPHCRGCFCLDLIATASAGGGPNRRFTPGGAM